MAKALNVSLSVTADTGQARAALQQLQSSLMQLTTTPTNLTIGGTLKKEAVEATEAIASLQATLRNATNMQTGNLDLTKFTQQMQASGMSLQKYQSALSTMGTTGRQAFAQLANSIAQAEVPLRRSNTLLSEFWTTMKNTARWQISSSLLHGFMGTIQSAYHYAQDLNESLNNIQIVTGLSDEKMARFAESANRAAKSLSTTTTSYTDAALIYYQQGIRDDAEIASRVETTIKLANVSGQSAEKVSNQMTAIWSNFADGSHNLEYYADVITALGAATASSSEEIATGLSKFASVADTVGLSYENASAALATITATTRQSADSVGTGLRTLFSRLQSLKLGETLEDGVDLTKYTKALETVGVSALDANGNLRAMDDILDDLGHKWEYLTSAQKTALAQTVGGVRQYTTLIALMDNFDFYQENLQTALGSEGTVQKQADIYAKSWEAASKRVKASAQSIYSDLLDDKFFIGLNNTLAGFLDIIHNTITSLGGLKGVLLGIGSIITTVFADQAAKALSNFVFDIQMLTPGGVKKVQNQQKIANDLLIQQLSQGASESEQGLISAYKNQGELQGAYLANATKMNDLQKSIANSYLQQQQALIKNVELQEQAVNQQEKAAAQEERRTKGQIYTANGGSQTAESKAQAAVLDKLKQSYESIGKVEGTLKLMPAIDTNNIKEAEASLTSLGVTTSDFAVYGQQAETAFKNLTTALASGDVNAANAALEELEGICNGIPSAVANAKDSLVEMYSKAVEGTENADEKVKQFEAQLDKTLNTVQKSSSSMVEFKGAVQNIGTYTDQVKQKMQELAQANFTAAQGFVAFAGMVSTLGMALTSVRGLMNTWKDDTKSLTDKLLATATTLGIVTTMFSRAFSVDTMAKVATLGAKVASAITGTTYSFVGLGVSASTATGSVIGLAGALSALLGPLLAIAAVIGLFVALAQSIETPAEKAERLANNLSNAQEASQNAKTALQDLGNTFGVYDEAISKTNELTAGTAEYASELQKANDAARELINTYNLSPDQWHFDNGKMILNEGVKEELEAQAQAEVTRTNLNVATAKMRQAYNNGTYGMQQIERGNQLINSAQQAAIAGLPAIMGTYGLAALVPGIAALYGNEMRNKGAEYYGYENYAAYQQAYQDNPEYFKQAQIEREGAFSNAYKEYIGTLLSSNTDLVKQYGQESIDALADAYGAYAYEKIGTNQDQIEQELKGVHGLFNGTNWLEGSAFGISPFGDATIENIKDLFYQHGLGEGLKEYLDSDEWKSLQRKGDMTDMINALKEQYTQQRLLAQSTELATADLKKYGDQFSKSRQYTTMSAEDREAFMEELQALDQAEPVVQYLMDSVNKMLAENLMGLSNSIAQNTNGTLNEEQVKGLNKNLSIAEMGNFGNILASFNQAFGKESATAIRDKLVEQINSGNKELFNAISNLDMSGNAIEILGQMNRVAKNPFTSDNIRESFNDFIETSISELGSKGIFEQLYQSESFADSLESLQKTYKKTGKIGAEAILDIADGSDVLSDALEMAKFNAAGLSDILEAMELGDLGIDDLTDELLEAMSAAGELKQNLAEAFNFIDNWNPDRSVMDLGKAVTGWISDSINSIEAGFYGDPYVTSTIGKVFGNKALDSFLDSWIYATGDQNWSPEEVNKYMNGANADMYDAMRQMKKWGDVSPLYGYFEKQSEALNALWDFDEKTGQVTTHTDEILKKGLTSQDAYIDYLTKNGIDADIANLMAASTAYTDGTLYKTWQTTAANNGLNDLIGKEGGITTGKQLKAFYDEYGRYLTDANGEAYKDFDSFVSDMRETAHSQIVALSQDFDYANASLQDLKDEMVRTGSGELEDYLTGITGKTQEQGRSVEDLTNAYEKLGFSAKQAYKLIDEEWQAGNKGTKEDFARYFNIDQASQEWKDFEAWLAQEGFGDAKISAEQYQDFLNDTAAKRAAEQQAKVFTDAFTQAFSNLEINYNKDTGDITIKPKVDMEKAAEDGEKAGETITNAAQNATEPVEVTTEYTPMSDAEAMLSQSLELANQIQEALTLGGEKLSEFAESAGKKFEELSKSAKEGISEWWAGIEEGIAGFDEKVAQWKEAAQEKATQWWSDFQTELGELETTIQGWKEAAIEKATNWWSDVQTGLSELSTTVDSWKDAAIEKITNWWSEIESGMESIDSTVASWKEAAIEKVTQWWADIQDGISELSSTIDGWKEAAIEKVTSWWSDIQEGISELSSTVNSWKEAAVEQVTNWWADIQTGMESLSTTLSSWKDSIVEGISNWWSGIVDGISQIGTAIADWFKNPFGEGWEDSAFNPKNWFGGRKEEETPSPEPEVDKGTNKSESELLSQIVQNTGDMAEGSKEPPGRVVENGASTTTQTQTVTNTTTINNQQIAQATNTSEATVALVSALKQAGVTAETYEQGETIDQIDWSGLEAGVSEALSKALADANQGETLTNEEFKKVSAEIDNLTVNTEDIEPVEIPGKITDLDDSEVAGQETEPIETSAEITDVDDSALQEAAEEPLQATVDYELGSQEEPEDENADVYYDWAGQDEAHDDTAGVYYDKSGQEPPEDMTATVNYKKGTQEPPDSDAAGYNNAAFAQGYSGSRHLAGSYEGLATVGELGPELMIHGNQAYLVGTHGRVTTYVQPDDQIFTAAQTQRILASNPLMREIPGFSVGYNHDQTVEGSAYQGGGGGGGGGDKSSTKEIKESLWYPERYHLIERQIDDLTRAYEKLSKAKDRAYGTNRLRAINDEIKAHKELMQAQQKEINEAKRWLEYDKAQLQQAGLWGEIQLDANGNIANFDELQNRYSRAIKQGLGIVGEVSEEVYEANEKAKEEAQKKWDLIVHYEETLDKLKDLDDDYLDSLYELADMLQEFANTKVEIRININQKELDLLEHYIKQIDNNVWATGDVLNLIGDKLEHYVDQIAVYRKGMDDLLKNATNAKGEAVVGLDLATWMALTPEQRDALNLDTNLMEKIEDYEAEILKVLDNIEDLKTKGLKELAEAFDEVNDRTLASLTMFENYADTISRLKNMVEVQMAFKPTSETNKILDKMDRAAIRQNRDELKARQAYTKELEKEREIILDLYDKEQDVDRKKLYKEQLEEFDSLILSEEQKIEDLWQNSADAIKNIYDRLIDDINEQFEKDLNYKGYDSEDLYLEGKNTRQAQQDETVDDYERLYRLSSLQKKVDKDIDERLNSNLKNNKRLLAIQQEIQDLRDSGVEMSEYELELLEKKYEYELAMAQLEDDVNAQSTVRFTRDRNGNLGYVFSAVPDAASQYEKEQAAMDALYERQKLDQNRLNEVATQIDELSARYKSELATLQQQVENGEITVAEAMAQKIALQAEYQKQIDTYMRDLNAAMTDSAITQPLMVERYGDQNATIRDSFDETSNAIINEALTIQDYFTSTNEAFDDFLDHYQEAIDNYDKEMHQLNKDVSEGTEDFEYLAEQQLKALKKASKDQLDQVKDNIEEMQKVIGEGDAAILAQVEKFNKLYSEKFQPVIDTNEKFLEQLLDILSLLNSVDYNLDNQNTAAAGIPTSTSTSGYSPFLDGGQGTGYDWSNLGIDQGLGETDWSQYFDTTEIMQALQLQVDAFNNALQEALGNIPDVSSMFESALQQQVNITAQFPSAFNRSEIVAAFSDLENQAYQYANRKGSMMNWTA